MRVIKQSNRGVSAFIGQSYGASETKRMRLLSIVEASSVTGPLKPLLMFSRLARTGVGRHPPIHHSLLTTSRIRRGGKHVESDMLRAARADGLEVDVVPEQFAFDPRVLGAMAQAIRMRAPDVVETHDFKSHFLFWLLRRTRAVVGPRWLAFHHGYTRMSPRVRLYQQFDRLSLREADKVVTLCKPFVEQLEARGVSRARITVITNAIAPRLRLSATEVLALRQSLGIEATELLMVSVGRLSREKGHADLIRAFRMATRQMPANSCRLLLVGDGGERTELMSQAMDLGDRIRFVGHQADAWPYFCMADIFVLPSHTEGSPLVLLEAMAAGLPIVATTVGGIPEVVRDGESAVLVPSADVKRLASSLSALARDPALREALGSAARVSVQQFSPQAYTSRLLSLYPG
jgi:glycosyltransferase involved in cell wall biosynthesis